MREGGGAGGGGEKSIDEYAAAAPETIQRGSYSEGYSGSNAARWPVFTAENKHGWLRFNQRLCAPVMRTAAVATQWPEVQNLCR